jgi:hypothetical protein
LLAMEYITSDVLSSNSGNDELEVLLLTFGLTPRW